jgi:hypothetical protein
VITEDGCRLASHRVAGTTAHLDQAENRALVARHAAGRRMLDAFCFSGGFACHALPRGSHAVLLDSSPDALSSPAHNLELNGLSIGPRSRRQRLRSPARARGGGRAFRRSRPRPTSVHAAQGFGERGGGVTRDQYPRPASRRLGVLRHLSCSHHISPGTFRTSADAAGDAGVRFACSIRSASAATTCPADHSRVALPHRSPPRASLRPPSWAVYRQSPAGWGVPSRTTLSRIRVATQPATRGGRRLREPTQKIRAGEEAPTPPEPRGRNQRQKIARFSFPSRATDRKSVAAEIQNHHNDSASRDPDQISIAIRIA